MNRRTSWIAYIALIPLAGVLGYLVVWLIKRRQQSISRQIESIELPATQSSPDSARRQSPGDWVEMAAEKMEPVAAAPKGGSISVEPDDLKKIKGIGPKIARALEDAGIVKFEQLAKANAAEVERILRDAGVRLANLDTWAAQARLAADGDWDALDALQNDLRGGRRF